MPISPQTNSSPEWPFSQNWLPSPTKASVPAMVNLAATGPPPEVATNGWSLAQPSSPRATLSLLAGDWDGGVAESPERGHGEGTQTGTDTGECKFLRGRSLGTKVPEAGGLCITALSVPSTCSASAAESPRSLRTTAAEPTAAQWPRWPGSGPAFSLAPFHQPFSPPPPSPGALGKEVASRHDRRRRRGEI